MSADWSPLGTSTHQGHVIKHVLGATVLGYFVLDEALHLVLDIGLVWSIMLDGQMELVPEATAFKEFEIGETVRRELVTDAGALRDGAEAGAFARVTAAPHGCLIEDVELYTRGEERRILLRCEAASLCVETSLASRAVSVAECGA